MLADAFFILGALLLIALAFTQVFVPLLLDKPLFGSFRKSCQREKWLKQQLAETQRRLAELELEKQLTDQHNELIRRQIERMESYTSLPAAPVVEDPGGQDRRKNDSEKER